MITKLEAIVFDDESRYVDRFGPLLVLTIIVIVAGLLVDLAATGGGLSDEIATFFTSAMIGGMLLLAFRATGVARRWQIVFDVAVGIGIAASLLLVIGDLVTDATIQRDRSRGPALLWVVMALTVPILLTRRLIRHPHVSRGTLIGAVCAYLAIAIAFDLTFLAVDANQSTPFFGDPEPTTTFMYFSLQSISTLGLGDVAPATAMGRALTAIEAVGGQLFLVSFFAMLVSLFVGRRSASG